MKNIINWKLYFILLVASVLSIMAVLPYAFTLASDIIKQSPLSLPLLALVSVAQSSVLFAVVLFLGLKLSKKVGLGLPIVEDYIARREIRSDFKTIIKNSILIGAVSGLAIILADFIFAKSGVGISLWSGQMPPAWMGFLASFYGGISEEILLRLFFMAFLVWLFSKIKRTEGNILHSNSIMWSAIIIAAIIFGLGHLPITGSMTAITAIVVLRAIVLNGIGGVVFGWLYWKKGLESSIIAHFSCDIVLYLIFPFLLLI